MSPIFPLSINMGLNRRDIVCLTVAVAVHSLLFLWKGMPLALNQAGQALGDSLVRVDFLSDVPVYEEPGGGNAKPKSFLSRVRSILKGTSPAVRPPAPAPQQDAFTNKKGFEGFVKKDEDADIAKGKSTEVLVKSSQGDFKKAEPNLKQKRFTMAPKDTPFQVTKAKEDNILSNANQIPINVGRTTSNAVKSLDGGPGAGAALQSKNLATRGGFAASSLGKGGSAKGGGDEGLMTAGGGSSQIDANGGIPGGTGTGTVGQGSGRGTGTGHGNGSGSGRGVGGRGVVGGFSGSASGSAWANLPRNTVTDVATGGKSSFSKDTGFNITGALAKRPVLQRSAPPYEMDARVALRFRVDWSGRVLDGILVEISSGNPSFDQRVIQALKGWVFSRLAPDQSHVIQEGVITFIFKGV